MSDLLFEWFEFDQIICKASESKQNKQKVIHTVILPLKIVFSANMYMLEAYNYFSYR